MSYTNSIFAKILFSNRLRRRGSAKDTQKRGGKKLPGFSISGFLRNVSVFGEKQQAETIAMVLPNFCS